MILIAAALLCVVSVPLTGGRLGRLGELRFRWGGAVLAALALQVVITTLVPAGSEELNKLLHVASYVVAGACIWANRHIFGLPLLALGAALNSLAIALNGGVMPASARAMELAGLPLPEDFANSGPVADPKLLAFGDVIPVPGPWPLGNVVSVGDLLIVAGLAVILHHAARRVPDQSDGEGPRAAIPGSGPLRSPTGVPRHR